MTTKSMVNDSTITSILLLCTSIILLYALYNSCIPEKEEGESALESEQRRGVVVRRIVGCHLSEREFVIDNLLVRIHFTIEMIWWTGLAPWEFEFPFPGSLISTC